jgi:hypothetical protein
MGGEAGRRPAEGEMFEYLGVLIAVILGLSLTHLLRGLSRLIHMRRTVKPYWVQIVWTVNILIYVLAVWWGMCRCNTQCIYRPSSSFA